MTPQFRIAMIGARAIMAELKRTPYIQECLRRFREGVEANKLRMEFRRKSRIKLFGRGVVGETWIDARSLGLTVKFDDCIDEVRPVKLAHAFRSKR